MLDAFRFFRIVPPVPSLMVTTFVVVTAASVAAVAVDPHYARGTLNAVIVLQLFSAASGFAGPARRGYYDLLLARGERRGVIGAVHWVMSVLPGIASWVVVSAAEAMASPGFHGVGFASGTITAVLVVSTIAWATTVPLPRFAGSIGWIVTFVMGAALLPAEATPASVMATVYPLVLIGRSVRADPWSATPALALGMFAMIVALAWIHRTDVPLEAAQ